MKGKKCVLKILHSLNYIVFHESKIAHSDWHKTLLNLPITHLSMKCQIIVRVNSIDKLDYICNATIATWGNIDVVVCISHLIRYWIEGRMSKCMNHQSNFDFMFY